MGFLGCLWVWAFSFITSYVDLTYQVYELNKSIIGTYIQIIREKYKNTFVFLVFIKKNINIRSIRSVQDYETTPSFPLSI